MSCTWVAVHCIWPLLFAVIGASSHRGEGWRELTCVDAVAGICSYWYMAYCTQFLHVPLPWITTRIESWLHSSNFVLAGSTYSKSGAQHSIMLSSWLGMVGIWFDKNSVLRQTTTTALLWMLLTPFQVVRPHNDNKLPQHARWYGSRTTLLWKPVHYSFECFCKSPVCPVCRIKLRTPPRV